MNDDILRKLMVAAADAERRACTEIAESAAALCEGDSGALTALWLRAT